MLQSRTTFLSQPKKRSGLCGLRQRSESRGGCRATVGARQWKPAWPVQSNTMCARRVLTTIIRKMSLQSSTVAARRVKSISEWLNVLGWRRLWRFTASVSVSVCTRKHRPPKISCVTLWNLTAMFYCHFTSTSFLFVCLFVLEIKKEIKHWTPVQV